MERGISVVLLFSLLGTSALADEIDFTNQIRPILSKNCYFCHGPDAHERKADLRLDSYEGATEDRDGMRAIDPENLADSEFIHRITSTDPDEIMPTPKSHKKLSSEEIDLLTRWIQSGAHYVEHWSFAAIPEQKSALPQGATNPVDLFIDTRLEDAGIPAAPAAEPHELIRRVTLDLTGLPPTPEEVTAFVVAHAADTEAAWMALIDHLLASEHFGERMALAWMDAARYGDSSVMHADGPRDMWPWRDWIIKAYNANKPFSEFLREQLAGDLLPGASFDQKVATGFNRNNATSDEGGAFAEELRVDYTVDRVQTTANVFLGLSMECAQCHDHKYDPISQREYFQFYAYFNNHADPGMQSRRGNQAPLVKFTVGGDQEKAAGIDKQVAQVDARLSEIWKAAHDSPYPQWLATATAQSVVPPQPRDAILHLPFDPDTTLPLPQDYPFLRIASEEDGFHYLHIDTSNTETVAVPGEDTPDLDLSAPFTAAYSIRTRPDTAHSAVASRMGKDHRGWDLWLEKGKQPGIHLVDHWPDNALKVITKKPIKQDQWQHVVITYDGSRKAKGVKIYVEGKPVPTIIATDTLKPKATNNLPKASHPFHLAARPNRSVPLIGDLDDLRIFRRVLVSNEITSLHTLPLRNALAADAATRTPEQQKLLLDHFLVHYHPPHQEQAQEKGRLLAERAEAMKGAKDYSSMIMADKPPAQMRKTYILDRGAYDSPKEDEVIEPGVPAFLPPLPESAPANRLGLADWMLREDHPLTARVAVNRYWTMLFGRGLSPTPTDFGNQGTSPTHPELLDWLARDFIDSGWDIKRMLRQIVSSQTYRRSSVAGEHARGPDYADPENLLLARSPRFRLQGDFIRDFALSTAGLLVHEVGGPGAKPYQPAGLWNEVSLNPSIHFVQDKGENLYRKSMYIYWKRSAPHPGMVIFDAPTREKCVVQRPRTNTPLQALVTLNDIQFVEASRHLARRMAEEGGETLEARIKRAYLLCLSREPTAQELSICADVYQAQLASFHEEPARATAYLAQGDSPRKSQLPEPEHAALTVLANLILNLDETLTRG